MENLTIFANNYQNQFIVKVESNGQTVIFDGRTYLNKVPKTFDEIDDNELPQWKQETIESYINEARKNLEQRLEFNNRVATKKKELSLKQKSFKKAFKNIIESIETL